MPYTITGDNQDNYLYGDYGPDTIYGLDGNDVIFASPGDDTLVGGRGNDLLEGSSGNNTYVFERGDGIDTIDSTDFSFDKHNTIAFGDGITPADVRLSRDGDSLVLALPDSGNLIIVKNFFDHYVSSFGPVRPWAIEQVQFASGESWSVTDITRLMLPPALELGEGDDIFQGNHANVNGNGGDDVLYTGVSAALHGGSGNDRLYAGEGDDLLTGGSGNDLISPRGGVNTIFYARGWGQDHVEMYGTEYGFTTLHFNAILSGEISFARPNNGYGPGNNLLLTSKTSTDSISLIGYFDRPYAALGLSFANGKMSPEQISQTLSAPAGKHLAGTSGDEPLYGSMNGDVITGMGGFDLLAGYEGDDVLIGGDGREVMVGDAGADTFMPGAGDAVIRMGEGDDLLIFGREAGSYRVENESYGGRHGGTLTIALAADIQGSELRFERLPNEIKISLNNSGAHIVLPEILVSDPAGGKVRLAFPDGTIWGADVLLNKLFTGTDFADRIEGTACDDQIRGNDGSDALLGLGGDDALHGGNGHDFLNGVDGNDELFGDGGHDYLLGGEGNDILTGGPGYDELTGGAGNDTYRFGLLDGEDTIFLPDPTSGERPTQTLAFGVGIHPADIVVRAVRDRELFLAISNDRGSVRMMNFGFNDGPIGPEVLVKFIDGTVWNRDTLRALTMVGNDGDELIKGFDSDDTLFGFGGKDTLISGNGNDTLDGGTGDDYLVGEGGRDTYVFRLGDGFDTLADSGWEATTAFRFGEDIKPFDVSFERVEYGYLLVRYSATDKILVHMGPQVDAARWFFSHFEFADGSIRSFDQLNVHAPTVYIPIIAPAATEGQQFMWGIPEWSFADFDKVDAVLNYELAMKDGSALPAWIRFEPNGAFSGTPGSNDSGVLNFIVTAVDQQGHRVPTTFSLTVKEGNQAPTVAAGITDLALAEGAAFMEALPRFADADQDALTLAVTMANGDALPGWMRIDQASGKLTGTPGFADSGTYALTATATDPGMLAVASRFNVVVANTNRAPALTAIAGDVAAAEGTAFSSAGPAFADPDSGDVLRYSVTLGDGTGLPSWMQFDPATGRLFGTPTFASSGSYVLKSTVTDGAQLSASSSFALQVADVNQAPVLSVPVADQPSTEGAPFSFVLPGATFTDADAGESGSLSVTGLPAWLAFNAATGTFSGTPAASEVGAVALGVRFTDSGGLFAQDSFNVTVAQAAAMTLTGTASADVLTGKSNADTLSGLGGDDVLDGALGADRMLGGLGNDVYQVDNAADAVRRKRV